MKTLRVSLFGVPAHPVVNDVPGSLLPAASLCDVVFLLRGDPSWSLAAFRFLQLGNVSAVLAAAFGALDFLRLSGDPDIQQLGRRHAGMNVTLLPLFLFCQVQRRLRSSVSGGAHVDPTGTHARSALCHHRRTQFHRTAPGSETTGCRRWRHWLRAHGPLAVSLPLGPLLIAIHPIVQRPSGVQVLRAV